MIANNNAIYFYLYQILQMMKQIFNFLLIKEKIISQQQIRLIGPQLI